MKLKLITSILISLLCFNMGFATTVAISYFDNNTGSTKYNSLSKGIADMLITDLSKIDGMSIVEREKLEALLEEIKFGQSAYINPKTAQKIGKGLGAESILSGAFFISGNQIRIDARLIDVESSEIILAEQVTGESNNFFVLHSKLVALISQAYKISKTSIRTDQPKYQPVSIAALVSYSDAIDNFDQGLSNKAVVELEKTIEKYPTFIQAQDKLKIVRKNLDYLNSLRDQAIKVKIDELINNIDLKAENSMMRINNSWTMLLTSYSYNEILKFNQELVKAGIDLDGYMYGESSGIIVGEMMDMYNLMAFYSLKRYPEVISLGQEYLRKYPIGNYYQSVHLWVNSALKELEDIQHGKDIVDTKIDYNTYVQYCEFLKSFKGNAKFLTKDDRDNFAKIINKLIKYASEKNVFSDDYDMDDFEEVFEACLEVDEPKSEVLVELAFEIAEKNKKNEDIYFDILDMAEDMEESLFKQKQKFEKNKREYEEIIQKIEDNGQEEIFRRINFQFVLLRNGGIDIVEYLSNKYFEIKDEREVSKVVTTRNRAWEGLINVAFITGNLQTFEKLIKDYKDDKFLIENDKANHLGEVRDYEKDFRDFKSDYKDYLEDVNHYNIQMKLIEMYAATYKDTKQYDKEIKYRKQLVNGFNLSDEEASHEYFFIFFAYMNLGEFQQARKVGEFFYTNFKSSDFNETIKMQLDLMPR